MRRATYGRDREIRALRDFLERVPDGASAMVIEGVAGIGKTTLLREGVEIAGSSLLQPLSATASEADASVSLAVVADLLHPVFGALDDLPTATRRALEVALFGAGTDRTARPDPRGLALGVLDVLRITGRTSPVLIAIDDVQWVDAASGRVLRSVLRRMSDEPIRILVTRRRGTEDPLDLAHTCPHTEHVLVGPLDLGALRRIVIQDAGGDVPSQRELKRVADLTDGNPLFVLELMRSWRGAGADASAVRAPPTDLAATLRRRIAEMGDAARRLSLVMAASSRPALALLDVVPSGGAALAEVEQAGIATAEGDSLVFTHPLFASTIYAAASPSERRAVHELLSRVSPTEEERARHLALSTTGPNATVADVLERAANDAASRGSPDAAADLMEMAISLTPEEHGRMRAHRQVVAAECRFQSGDTREAQRQLRDLAEGLPPGTARADLLYRLALFSTNDVRSARVLLEQALADVRDSDVGPLRARVLVELAWTGILGGDLRRGIATAAEALQAATRAGSRSVQALASIASAYGSFLAGSPWRSAVDAAATLELELQGMDLLIGPRTARGAFLMWDGALDAARTELEGDHRAIIERGQFSMLWEVLVYLVELELRAGNWPSAQAYAREGLDSLEDAGLEQALEVHLWSNALVAAHVGDEKRARSLATRGLALAELHGDVFHVVTNRSVLGFVALSLGDAQGATDALAPLDRITERMGVGHPGAFPYLGDRIEAALVLGDRSAADRAFARTERLRRVSNDPVSAAGAARSRALLLADDGDVEGSSEVLEHATVGSGAPVVPFELARTLLTHGRVLRRLKRKRPAREAFERAHATFVSLGAPRWAATTARELERIGGRPQSPDELTAGEREIAKLVAAGLTNREVAQALHLSPETVGSTLKRVYRKERVRSRTELAARFRSRDG